MTFGELLENWINEKITRSQTDLVARISKLEMKVGELERLAAQRNNDDYERSLADRVQYLEQEQMSEYRVQEIIQTHLCDTDWSEMIGSEIDDRIEDKISELNLDDVPTESTINDIVRDVISDTRFTVNVECRY